MHFVLAKLINSRDMGYIISTLTSIYIILLLLLVFLEKFYILFIWQITCDDHIWCMTILVL